MKGGDYRCLLFVSSLIWAASNSAAERPPSPVVAPVTLPSQLEAGYSYEKLNNGYANWRSTYLDVNHKLAERHSVYASLRETDRFSLKDSEGLIGVSYPFSPRWTVVMEANASPTHHVLARRSTLGQVQYAFDQGWDVQLGLRHTDYNDAITNLGLLTVERYWKDYRIAYTRYRSVLIGHGVAASHRVQFSWYYDDRSSLGIAWSIGHELENISATRLLNTSVRAWVLGGYHGLTNRWGVVYEASYSQQGSFYTRNGIRIGLRHQF